MASSTGTFGQPPNSADFTAGPDRRRHLRAVRADVPRKVSCSLIVLRAVPNILLFDLLVERHLCSVDKLVEAYGVLAWRGHEDSMDARACVG